MNRFNDFFEQLNPDHMTEMEISLQGMHKEQAFVNILGFLRRYIHNKERSLLEFTPPAVTDEASLARLGREYTKVYNEITLLKDLVKFLSSPKVSLY